MKSLCSAVAVFGALALLVGCEQPEAEAAPREVQVPSEGVPRERRDPVTPGEDGVIEPTEDRVIMPPESLGEGIDHPDARDQLERDLVEEGHPQSAP